MCQNCFDFGQEDNKEYLAQEFCHAVSSCCATMRTKRSRLPVRHQDDVPLCPLPSASWRTCYKITETLIPDEVIKTVLLYDPSGRHTGTARWRMKLRRRTRRWSLPLRNEARAIQAKNTIPLRYQHCLDNYFRLAGGLDTVLRQSAEWPELPAWIVRLARGFSEKMSVVG